MINNNNNLIEGILKTTLYYFKANRVLLASIHSLSYKDLLVHHKVFSVTNECLYNADSVKSIIKDIPLSILELEQPFYKDDILVVSTDCVNPFPDKCIAHLNRIKTSCLININIKFSGAIIGILSIHFNHLCRYKSIDNISLEDRQFIDSVVSTISKYV